MSGWPKRIEYEDNSIAKDISVDIQHRIFRRYRTYRRSSYGGLLVDLMKECQGVSETLVKQVLDDMITEGYLKYFQGTIRIHPNTFRDEELSKKYNFRGKEKYT